MKKILFLIIVIFFTLIVTLVFLPEVTKRFDRWLLTEEEVLSWKQKAMDGNITAISNLIIFSKNQYHSQKTPPKQPFP